MNIVDVAGSSEWSHFARKKRPWPTFRAQGVGSIVGVHCGPERMLICSITALRLLASCLSQPRRCAHLFFTKKRMDGCQSGAVAELFVLADANK